MRITNSITIKIIAVIVFISFLGSCGNNENNGNGKKRDTLKNSSTESGTTERTIKIYKKYKLPLPSDLFQEMKQKFPTFMKESLNATTNSAKYQTNVVKSFNLGIYLSDLAYCSVFNNSKELLEYFNTCKKISEELGIPDGFDKTMIERLNSNLENKDTLELIVQESYWKSCNYLEEHNNLNILPFVVTGGWIESMHLAIAQDDKAKPTADLMVLIGNQKKTLNNLIDYLYDVMIDSNAFELNAEIKTLILKLNDLMKTYAKIRESININQYQEITLKVEKIRDGFVK